MPFSFRPQLSEIWREREFRRFWTGETISVMGSSITEFALPVVAVITLRASPEQMGLLRALGNVPGIFIGLLAGVWVDRVSRQRLLIGLNIGAGLLVAWIPVSYALHHLSLGQLYVVELAFGVLGPFWWPAWNAFLPSIVGARLLVEANSKMAFSFSSTGIVGPALGGVLVQTLGAPWAMLFDAGSFGVCSSFLATLRPRRAERPLEEATVPTVRRIVEGLRLTFLDPMQRAVTVPRAILDFMDALSAAVIVIYVLRNLRLSVGLMGLAFAVGSVGFVVGSVVAPRIEHGLGVGRAIVLGLFLVGASPYTMVIADRRFPDFVNVAFFALPGLIGGFGGIVQYVGLQALRQHITPERLLGRVYASASVLGRVLRVAGALFGGLIGGTIGLRPAIAIAAVGYGIPFVYSLGSPLRRATVVVADDAGTAPSI